MVMMVAKRQPVVHFMTPEIRAWMNRRVHLRGDSERKGTTIGGCYCSIEADAMVISVRWDGGGVGDQLKLDELCLEEGPRAGCSCPA